MKKVLLDENLPIKLKFRLQDSCNIYTINDMGWNALSNGNLLAEMQKENFDFLITSDNNLQFQQNLDRYKIRFIIISVPNNNL